MTQADGSTVIWYLCYIRTGNICLSSSQLHSLGSVVQMDWLLHNSHRSLIQYEHLRSANSQVDHILKPYMNVCVCASQYHPLRQKGVIFWDIKMQTLRFCGFWYRTVVSFSSFSTCSWYCLLSPCHRKRWWLLGSSSIVFPSPLPWELVDGIGWNPVKEWLIRFWPTWGRKCKYKCQPRINKSF